MAAEAVSGAVIQSRVESAGIFLWLMNLTIKDECRDNMAINSVGKGRLRLLALSLALQAIIYRDKRSYYDYWPGK